MASPWDIDRNEHVLVLFKSHPKILHPQKGPLWDPLEGTFQGWITEPGSQEKRGIILRVKWNISKGLSEIDMRIALDDMLMFGTMGQVSLVAGKHVKLPPHVMADDGTPLM